MALWLNKKLVVLVLFLITGWNCFSQDGVEPPVYKDYKDPEQFEKFRKRSIVVGAWQINTLKEEGAIVVRLKTNKLLIDQLIKQGNTKLAIEKQLEQFAINKNTMFAYTENFNFCKLYFIYSNSSDSLLNGTRQGIFLDSTLNVNPAITMTENFYLIAEKDYVYTSSIGFIREDSARFYKEAGNPVKSMAIVLKNKYGHQLKDPFPFSVKEKNFSNTAYNFPIKYASTPEGRVSAFFTINRTFLADLKTKPEPQKFERKENNTTITVVKLKREYTYEKLSIAVNELNDNLYQFLRSYPKPDIKRVNAQVKPFFY